MRFRIAALICVIFAVAVSLAAQSKAVTNSDLEKYRRERLKAEREYQENYVRLGLPSPEELDRRREQSRVETERLSTRLRSERLERERLDAERDAHARNSAVNYYYSQPAVEQPYYYASPYYYWSYVMPYRQHTRRRAYSQPGYFAGGQFWPTGPRTAPRPMLIGPRSRRR